MRRSKAGKTWLALFLCAMAAMALFAGSASASKIRLFEETFGPVAQPSFVGATSLAVDYSTGDLIVLDNKEKTLSRFHSDGTPASFSALGTNIIDGKLGTGGKACAEELASCDRTPENGFQFGAPAEVQVAVDNSATATAGDIYVADYTKHVVEIFASDGHYLGQLTKAGSTSFQQPCGVSVGADGTVYVGDYERGSIFKFSPSANPPLNTDNVASFDTVFHPCTLAAGAGPSSGSLFASSYASTLYKIDSSTGEVEYAVENVGGSIPAISPFTGHLFVSSIGPHRVSEYDASGAGPTLISTISTSGDGMATTGIDDRLYLSLGSKVDVYGTPVPIPDVTTTIASNIGKETATLNGTVNPDGIPLTECFFEYGTTTQYGETVPCAETPAQIGAGTTPKGVHADIAGLTGETTYHYRLVARNANTTGGKGSPSQVRGKDSIFDTAAKPLIVATWATDVIFTEGTLRASINPRNDGTTYHFEWGKTEAPYEHVTAETPVGSDATVHTVSLLLNELDPGVSYHWRVVATNGLGTVESDDHVFTTYLRQTSLETDCPNQAFRGGPSALLPDCRAYEMVSPVDKNGGNIRPRPRSDTYIQAAPDGERITYGATPAFGDQPSNKVYNQYLASRGSDGWANHGLNAPAGRQLFGPIYPFRDVSAFSPDLCNEWLTDFALTPLTSDAQSGYENLYRQDLCGAGGFEALSTYQPPKGSPAYMGNNTVQGFSEDLADVFFIATAGLTPDAVPGFTSSQIYDRSGGVLHLVSVLPDGSATTGTELGSGNTRNQGGNLEHSVSRDGSRVYWSSHPSVGVGTLYLRFNPSQPESDRLHGAATGTGDLVGPASGTGNLVATTNTIKKVKVESGIFSVGQSISGEGIPAGATIAKIEPEGEALKLTISKAANLTKTGVKVSGAPSEVIINVKAKTGAFEVGAEISGSYIPPGTTILAVNEVEQNVFKLTLSAKAISTETEASLSATSECTEEEKACTVPVSEGHSATFWTATPDGSTALYSELKESQEILYRFDADSGTRSEVVKGLMGVLGASDDLSRIYYLSSRTLTPGQKNGAGGEAQAGEPNLYLDEEGQLTFIATLASGKNSDIGEGTANFVYNVASKRVTFRPARVTADGNHIAFESRASLTGFDNTDAESEQADVEVFTYEAGGALRCVSCNPSGARPSGAVMSEAYEYPEQSDHHDVWAAAWIPAWEHQLNASNVLSENGWRIFFNSLAPLLPRDTNGAQDVYEWEAVGEGSCTAESASFHAMNGGCLYLITTGKSPFESEFWEASADGRDVFFNTESSLLPQDEGLIDLYDARVEGGFPQPAEAAECEGEACQSPPEAPNDPTPASESFQGAGNVPAEAAKPRKPCTKGKVRRKGHCVARKHAKHQRRAKRRAASSERRTTR